MNARKAKAIRKIMGALIHDRKDEVKDACIAKLLQSNRYGYVSEDMDNPRNGRARQHLVISPLRQMKKAVKRLDAMGAKA